MDKFMEEGQVVWNRGRTQFGKPTGSEHRCQLAGCNGVRVAVKWPDNKISFPCSRGLIPDGPNMRIG